jgi:hypothetical protein
MHAAVADKLRAKRVLVDGALERVRRWRIAGGAHPDYVLEWERLLALPLEQLCDAIVDRSERARALRQVSPFAGVLSARERWAIHRRVQCVDTADGHAASKP